MKLRDVCTSDWDHVYQLIEDNMFQMQQELGLNWDRNAILKHYMSKSVIVCELSGNLVGFIAYHLSDNAQYIDSLQVSKRYQNHLVGFRLLKEAIKQTRELTCTEMVRCCVFENNKAQNLYFSVGFRESNRKQGILSLEIEKTRLLAKLRFNL